MELEDDEDDDVDDNTFACLGISGEIFSWEFACYVKEIICQVTLCSKAVFVAEVEDDEEILACLGIPGKMFPWEFAS